MNPIIEITYQSEDNEIFKLTLDELRQTIAKEYGLSPQVENFSVGYRPFDGVKILEVRINDIVAFKKETPNPELP